MNPDKTSRLSLALAALLAALPAGVSALESLSDERLSDETGGAGLTVFVTNPNGLGTGGGTGTDLYLNPNNGAGSTSATFEAEGVQLNPIGEAGASTTNPFSLTLTLDAGADTYGAGIGLNASWTRTRLLDNRLLLLGGDAPVSPYTTPAAGSTGATAFAFGRTALDGPGSLALATSRGLLNSTATSSSNGYDPNMLLRLTLGPAVAATIPAQPSQYALYTTTAGYGQFYYVPKTAAGSPQLVLDNLDFDAGFNSTTAAATEGGLLGACAASSTTCGLAGSAQTNTFAAGSAGLFLIAPRLDFNFTFNFNIQAAPGTNLQTSSAANNYLSSAQALTVWGWMGDFSGTGGASTAAPCSASAPCTGAGLLLGGGGPWTNSTTASYNPDTPANRQNGINLAFHANIDKSNFAWYVGRPGEVLSFGNWNTLPGVTWSLNAPNITLGVVNAGQGVGGLCWGSTSYVGTGGTCSSFNYQTIPGTTYTLLNQNLETSGVSGKSPNNPSAGSGANTAAAILVRDLSLQAYSTQVQVFDDIDQKGNFTGSATANNGVSTSKTFSEPWSLVYTLGQMDSNIYLYPVSTYNGSGADNGLTADVILSTQSLKTNGTNPMLNNSNFMIGETCTAGSNCNIPGGASAPAWCSTSCILGVGLTQANLLFAANALQLNLNTSSATDGAGLQYMTNDLRMQTHGLFAGGLIQNSSGTAAMAEPGANAAGAAAGQNQVVALVIDANFESNAARLTVSPQLTSYNGPNTLPYPYMGLAGHFTFASPGSPNNGNNTLNTAPAATGLDIQPANCGTYTSRTCDGSYFSMGEPYAPASDFRFADIQGDVTILACQASASCNSVSNITNPSQIFLISAGDPKFNDGKPRLRVATNLAIGGCADSSCGTYATGAAPLSTTIKLDTNSSATIASPTLSNSPNALGTLVIPNAQIYSSVVLRPQ